MNLLQHSAAPPVREEEVEMEGSYTKGDWRKEKDQYRSESNQFMKIKDQDSANVSFPFHSLPGDVFLVFLPLCVTFFITNVQENTRNCRKQRIVQLHNPIAFGRRVLKALNQVKCE